MGCGSVSQRGPAVEVRRPLALSAARRGEAGSEDADEAGRPPPGPGGRAAASRTTPTAGGELGARPAVASSASRRGTGGTSEQGGRASMGRRFFMGERVLLASSHSQRHSQDLAFCFECGVFFQLTAARSPACSCCGSSFVQFLRGAGNLHWIASDSTSGLSFSFDDQLDSSITASLEAAPTGGCPTQASFLRRLPEYLLAEESLQARAELDPADPRRCCAICRENFVVGDSLMKLPCGHEFHSSTCCVPWLKGHNTCPVCRWKLPQAIEGEDDDDGEESCAKATGGDGAAIG